MTSSDRIFNHRFSINQTGNTENRRQDPPCARRSLTPLTWAFGLAHPFRTVTLGDPTGPNRHVGPKTSRSSETPWSQPLRPGDEQIGPLRVRGNSRKQVGGRAVDQNPSGSFTKTVVIRPGTTALLMTRRLFTPLGTP